jgi:hypothetical protein
MEQKLLPTENYLKNRVVFRTKFYATFWNNFYLFIFTACTKVTMTASKERKKVAVRLIANGSIIIILLINSLALEK